MSTRRSKEYPIWCAEYSLADEKERYTREIAACFEIEANADEFIEKNKEKFRKMHPEAIWFDMYVIELGVRKGK